MSTAVRVNLLPRELEEHARQRRVALMAGAGVAVWVALLGGLYGLKVDEVATREQDRTAEQAAVGLQQAELATLAPFRQLASEVENKNGHLSMVMAEEISWARVMNDLSVAIPSDASLQTFAATSQDVAQTSDTPGQLSNGEPVASVQFTGYSVDRFAPGVEAMLLDLSQIRSFFNVYLGTAAEAEIGTTPVTNFSGSSLLDDNAYTRRYESGLPVEDMP